MSIGIAKLFENAVELSRRGRLTLAADTLEQARALSRIPTRRAYATYALGVLFWAEFGDGVAARRKFLDAATEFDAADYERQSPLKLIHAAALENAMLCALSFDEFEELAERLRALTPDMPVLAGLIPTTRTEREHGMPWSYMLLRLAATYYNRNDPRVDRGGYGQAKSTYHLLLAHRRELRLKREVWRLALSEFCPLAMRLAGDCIKRRGGDADAHSPEEFLPILTEALPLVDEYLSAHSGDETLKHFRSTMANMVTDARQRWALLSTGVPQLQFVQVRCGRCHQPLDRPLHPCPACGSPSEIAGKVLGVALTGGLVCGGVMYLTLGVVTITIWLRVLFSAVVSFIGLLTFFSYALQYYAWRQSAVGDHGGEGGSPDAH
jgi:hypothetical protein